MANIELYKVSKTFRNQSGKKSAPFSIMDLDLSIPDGKTMVILGPSGCGKSTLLRLIAGLDKPDSGEVRFNGKNVKELAPKDRGLGMVFQNYALFPHMNAKKNITTYFMFKKKTPELEAEEQMRLKKTGELLGVEIEYLLDRDPKNLSGGEKQRVAIGRCITRDPSLFLMDEPFSALDAQLREKYRIQLKKLLNLFHVTTVYITHDQQEALVLADVIAVMRSGSIEQVGTFQEIYDSPQTLFAAEFLNPGSEMPALNLVDGVLFGRPGAIAGVRPQNVTVSAVPVEGALQGRVSFMNPMPVKRMTVMNVKAGDTDVYTPVPIDSKFETGQDVWLVFQGHFLFDGTNGKRLE